MNTTDVIAYISMGEIYCTDCGSSWDAEYSGCKEPTQLSDPGWHVGCTETSPGGNPCHAEILTDEGEIGVVFADAEGIEGSTCGQCQSCYGPEGWSEPNCDARRWRWSKCPSCNSQRPYSKTDTDARYAAFIGQLACEYCRKPTHF